MSFEEKFQAVGLGLIVSICIIFKGFLFSYPLIFACIMGFLLVCFSYVNLVNLKLCRENVRYNFVIIARLLESRIKKTFAGISVNGYYKERKINCSFAYIFRGNRCCATTICIEPLLRVKRKIFSKEFFSVMPSKPTENTQYMGNIISYTCCSVLEKISFSKYELTNSCDRSWLGALSLMKLNEEDIVFFFEELTRAAIIVESNPEKFASLAGELVK